MCWQQLSISVLLVVFTILLCVGPRNMKEKKNLLIISGCTVFILSFAYLSYYYPIKNDKL